MSADLLFELGVEELPSGSVLMLAKALQAGMEAGLTKARLSYGQARCFATPRRLAVLIESVQQQQAPYQVSQLGPKKEMGFTSDGVPTKALLGFAASVGVPVEQLIVKETPKGPRFAYEAEVSGLNTVSILPGMVQEAIQQLPITKPMYWGAGEVSFVRPVHWVVLLFGDAVIDVACLGCQSGRTTIGHRYHYPQAMNIKYPAAYASTLRDGYVIADFSLRKTMIQEAIRGQLLGLNAEAVMPDALLDEVTSIIEWPTALLVDFEPAFLNIPAEVLIESMQVHQKCFAVRSKQGALLPHFITISNIESHNPEQVIAGNQRVMHARLSDAAFFFAEDKKQSLQDRVEDTKKVVFQAKLGTLYNKVERLEHVMCALAPLLGLNQTEAVRAARLSKSDLLTGMVGEFPELQGTMGYYYALHDGESMAVAEAIQAQYFPRFSGDVLPSTVLGLALSLADRLDTLVGIFGIGKKPTGESDPFKLRRHALAIVRLLIAMPVSLKLSECLVRAIYAYGEQFSSDITLIDHVQAFILERIPAFYTAMTHATERVRAVLARQSDCLRDMDARIKALELFEASSQAGALVAVSKRVSHLLKQTDFNHQFGQPLIIDESLLTLPAEKDLYQALTTLEAFVELQLAESAYGAILIELASLQKPLDVFFESVMVMVHDDKIKMNRLKLLARLQSLLQVVADVSLLPQV